MAGENINQAELARVAALGQGKSQGKDPAGEDNAVMELLTGAANGATQALKYAVPIPGGGLLTGIGSSSAVAGLESEGLAGKTIMPGSGLRSEGGFLAKLLALLIKGGFQIKDLTEGVGGGPLIEGLPITGGESISMASLGTFAPDYTPTSEVGRGSGVRYDM